MKKAREKWLIKGGREIEEHEYHHKRKEAHKLIRNKKKLYIRNVIESIEEDQKHNNTRKIYHTINQFKKGYQHKFHMIRNKKGELAKNTKERAEIWKEYLVKLLNTEEPKELIKIGNRETNKVEVEELTIEDVKRAMSIGISIWMVVIKQNCRFWAAENPRELHQKPLHTAKVSVSCGISKVGIVGPYFFEEEGATVIVISERYVEMLRNFLRPQLRS